MSSSKVYTSLQEDSHDKLSLVLAHEKLFYTFRIAALSHAAWKANSCEKQPDNQQAGWTQ